MEIDKLKALKKFKEMQKKEEKWEPVSNIEEEKPKEDDIYKDLPKVKKWHEDYVRMWLGKKEK